MNNAVSFKDLCFSYKNANPLFVNYSADIPKGGVFAVLGPNGRGKTTLLNILLGLLKPLSGTVSTAGSMALVPQLFHLTFAFSALDMVLMGRAKKIGLFGRPSADDVDKAMDALDRTGMAAFAKRPFHSLSGGERQLVILARALVSDADTLLMDEPTSALDLKNQAAVLGRIAELSKEYGMTVILTTHHPHHALAVADRSLLMIDSNRCVCGLSQEVLNSDNLYRLYGVPLKLLEFDYEGEKISTLVPIFIL
jgi:iron complex transport system ATP-binding protein